MTTRICMGCGATAGAFRRRGSPATAGATRLAARTSCSVPPLRRTRKGVTFPLLQARYYSRRYGGVRIAWRAHVSNLPRWHDIDAQIWKFIDAWNVARAPDEIQRH